MNKIQTKIKQNELKILWLITFLFIFLIIPLIAQKIYIFLNDSSTYAIYQSDIDNIFICLVTIISFFTTIKSFKKLKNNFLTSFIPVVVLFLMLASGLIYHFFVPAKTWENGGCYHSSMCADSVTKLVPVVAILIVLNLILILIGAIFFRVKYGKKWVHKINRINFLYFSSIPLIILLFDLFQYTISRIFN